MPDVALDAMLKEPIKSFRDRAGYLRRRAVVILAIICALLGGGAVVFVIAPFLTARDLYPLDLNKTAIELRSEIEKTENSLRNVDDKVREYQAKRDAVRQLYGEALGQFTTSDRVDCGAIFAIRLNLVSETDPIMKGLSAIASKQPCFIVELREKPIAYAADKKDEYVTLERYVVKDVNKDTPATENSRLMQAVEATRKLEVPVVDYEAQERLRNRWRVLKGVEERLVVDMFERAFSLNAPGKENTKDAGAAEVPLAQIVQTNITRFGTIIMIVFLVSILTPLYRYNVRLATFYDARADALGMLTTGLGNIPFADLAQSFTPAFDFGKPPATPMDQAIDLARQIIGAKEADAKK